MLRYYNCVILFGANVACSVSLQVLDNLVKASCLSYYKRSDYLGLRTLAYPIKGHLSAHYFSIWFLKHPTVLKTISDFLTFSRCEVIRALIIKTHSCSITYINDN